MFDHSNKRVIRQYRGDTMGRFFDRVFPKLFIGIFVVVFTGIIVQFAVMGYVAYQVVTDPEGAANFVGNIAGEAVRPVAEAIRGE